MIYSLDLTEDEIQREPCVICGKSSKHVLAQSAGPESSFAVPEGHIRMIVYGMCDTCFHNRTGMSKEQVIEVVKTLMRQNAERIQDMMSATKIKH
jgi:hypothetical protein